ncbi:MAG: GntR family transcriptional regulator [Betaproteobacteria bacterium]|nr:GntR family transcriptional regulator [Betaproteobacteria bacterium]
MAWRSPLKSDQNNRCLVKILSIQPNLVEQVHEAILLEISSGKLAPGSRIIQEQIATELGVSRQPVQQALLLLRNQGVLSDAPGRGLIVAPLDPDHIRHMYDVRAVIEGLAFRKAALNNADLAKRDGPAFITKGREAAQSGSVSELIAADMAFHHFVYSLSENLLVAPAMDAHWTYTQRVMGEVLMRDEKPRDIWDQHEALLQSIISGDGDAAEVHAREHILAAAHFIIERISTH